MKGNVPLSSEMFLQYYNNFSIETRKFTSVNKFSEKFTSIDKFSPIRRSSKIEIQTKYLKQMLQEVNKSICFIFFNIDPT